MTGIGKKDMKQSDGMDDRQAVPYPSKLDRCTTNVTSVKSDWRGTNSETVEVRERDGVGSGVRIDYLSS
jgi:hypothetical protein